MLILYHPILWVQLFVWILTWSMINFSTILWCQHMRKKTLRLSGLYLDLVDEFVIFIRRGWLGCDVICNLCFGSVMVLNTFPASIPNLCNIIRLEDD